MTLEYLVLAGVVGLGGLAIAYQLGWDNGFDMGYHDGCKLYQSFRDHDNETWEMALHALKKDNDIAAELKLQDEELYNRLAKIVQVKKRLGIDGSKKET